MKTVKIFRKNKFIGNATVTSSDADKITVEIPTVFGQTYTASFFKDTKSHVSKNLSNNKAHKELSFR